MKRVFKLAAALSAAGLLQACAATKPPSLQIENLKFKRPGLTGASMDVFFNIRNPNPGPLAIERFEYDLALNGKRIGRGYYPDAVSLAGFAAERVQAKFDINFLRLPGAIKTIFDQDRVKADVEGKFYVKERSGLKSLKFKSNAQIKLN